MQFLMNKPRRVDRCFYYKCIAFCINLLLQSCWRNLTRFLSCWTLHRDTLVSMFWCFYCRLWGVAGLRGFVDLNFLCKGWRLDLQGQTSSSLIVNCTCLSNHSSKMSDVTSDATAAPGRRQRCFLRLFLSLIVIEKMNETWIQQKPSWTVWTVPEVSWTPVIMHALYWSLSKYYVVETEAKTVQRVCGKCDFDETLCWWLMFERKQRKLNGFTLKENSPYHI